MNIADGPGHDTGSARPSLDTILATLRENPGTCEESLLEITGMTRDRIRAALAYLQRAGQAWAKKASDGETYYFPELLATDPSAIRHHLLVVRELLRLSAGPLNYAGACLELALERIPEHLEHCAVGWPQLDDLLAESVEAVTPVSQELQEWLPRLDTLRALVRTSQAEVTELNRLIQTTRAGAQD
jgi:hypothetical protein